MGVCAFGGATKWPALLQSAEPTQAARRRQGRFTDAPKPALLNSINALLQMSLKSIDKRVHCLSGLYELV